MMETPNNLNAEMAILGRMIRFGDKAHTIAAQLRDEHFYSSRHKLIFAELCKITQTCSPNFEIVASRLEPHADVIGRGYLYDLADSVVSMVGFEAEASLILDAHKRRQMIKLSQWALAEAYESDDTDEMLSGAVAKISEIVNGSGGSRSGFSHAASNLDSVLSDESPRETPTGLPWFDAVYTPRPGNFIVLAGFSGGGKTALAAGIATSMSQTGNVLLASLEMSKDEILERAIPWASNIEIGRIRKRTLTPEEKAEAREAILRRGLYITEAESVYEVEQAARSLKVSKGLDAVIIDYLQLLTTPRGKSESNRAQEVAAISRHCKLMARRLDCVVYALSQLNNDASKDGIPKIHQLKESGGIRQDADAVFMVYHPDKEQHDHAKNTLNNLRGAQRSITEEDGFKKAKIIIAKRVLDLQKGRSAEETSTQLMFEGRYTRFRPATTTEWSMK
jgi:replicative DNA helicase